MTVYSGIDCGGVVRMCMYVTFVDLCFSYIVDITISTSVCSSSLQRNEGEAPPIYSSEE